MTQTKAKLFTHGGSQAVRLPKAFRFEGDEVFIRRDGDTVVLEPKRKDFSQLWRALESLRDLDDPFPAPPPQDPMADPIDLDR